MSKLIKEMITSELRTRFDSLDSALWVEMLGIDGLLTNDFRRALRSKQMRLEVVKNALFRRATDGKPLEPLAKALDGPAALITGGSSLTDVAKLVEEWAPKLKTLKMRGAVLEGTFIDEKSVVGLSKMPTKRDLQGQVARAIQSPGAKLASAILAGGGNIAGCLKALIEKLEKGGPAEAAAAPEGAAPADAAPAT